MESGFLLPFVIIFGASALVVFILGKLRLSSIIGFLVAGVIIGPNGLDLIKDVHIIEALAEVGVILLMFTIGLEFSLKNLAALRSIVLGGGSLQVGLTTAIVAAASYLYLGQDVNKAIFAGFLVSLSSTAIVFKVLLDRAEMNTGHGRSSVGILIFQDLCVVPFMLLVPVLSGRNAEPLSIGMTLLKAAVVVVAVLISARWVVPKVLHQVVSTRSRELFVITIIVLCLGTALLTSVLGVSLALGAFLAGIVISESEYAAQAVSDVLPFKESFLGLFFIAVGMLLDGAFFREHLGLVLPVVFAIILIKVIAIAAAVFVLGYSPRNAFQTGLYLSQIGEFSFVLAMAGRTEGLISESLYQTFLSASIVTMILTPLIVMVSSPLSHWFASLPALKKVERKRLTTEKDRYPKQISDHVIIVGFGVNGGNLARVLKESNIPYAVIETNSNVVRKAKKKGEPIYYGDGTSVEILHKVHIEHARIITVAISDAAASRRIVQIARKQNPYLYIIVRTRYLAEVDDLKALGANEVIPEEFETSVEIFAKVLHRYHVPINVIRDYISATRSDSYLALRSVELPRKFLGETCEILQDVDIETYLVREGSVVDGQSLRDLNLRARTGVTVFAVERNGETHRMPPASFKLTAGDVMLFVGTRDDILKTVSHLEGDTPDTPS